MQRQSTIGNKFNGSLPGAAAPPHQNEALLIRTSPSSFPCQPSHSFRCVCENAAPSLKHLSVPSVRARACSPLSPLWAQYPLLLRPPARGRPRPPARSAEKEERVKIKRPATPPPPLPSLCTVRRRDKQDLTRKLCFYRHFKVMMKRPVLHNTSFQ